MQHVFFLFVFFSIFSPKHNQTLTIVLSDQETIQLYVLYCNAVTMFFVILFGVFFPPIITRHTSQESEDERHVQKLKTDFLNRTFLSSFQHFICFF